MNRQGRAVRRSTFLFLSVVLLGLLAGTAAAKKEPKSYPEEGKIIGIGTTEHTHVNGSIFGAPGTATTGNVGSRSKYTYTYKIQTGAKILQLDCGQEAVFHSTGKECGGEKPLKVGDVIHFRIEKESVYILVSGKVSVDDYDASRGTREAQVEQKLRIMSEDDAPKDTPPAPAPRFSRLPSRTPPSCLSHPRPLALILKLTAALWATLRPPLMSPPEITP